MIRIIVVTADANAAAHIGGPVHVTYRTFDLPSSPELEAHMREPEGFSGSAAALVQRTIVGAEFIK